MDKIEKIHIARVPYSIEVKAESLLKSYLKEVRSNLDIDTAQEVIQDIESRIPELLAERNVRQNEVITESDVLAIKEQLGEPEQFSTDQTAEEPVTRYKKLFRDSDDAVIGGVASGIGKYLSLDANLVRVVFFILSFISGFGIILYLFLWLILPKAKTSADKLMMSGEPVTVATLQRYRSNVRQSLGNGPRLIQQVITRTFKLIMFIWCISAGITLLIAISVFSGYLYVYPFHAIFSSYGLDYLLLALIWVVCLSIIGLLVVLVLRLWGHRSAQIKVSLITLSGILILAVAGISVFGLVTYNHFSDEYGNGRVTTGVAVDNQTPTITPTELDVKSDKNLSLNYVVSSQPIHATYAAYPGLGRPDLTVVNSNGVLTVDSVQLGQAAPNCLGTLCKKIYLPIKVTLYGPSVKQISDINGANVQINNSDLGNLVNIKASDGSTVYINNSYATSLNITAVNSSVVQANSTSTQRTSVNVDFSSQVFVPNTNSLTAVIPENCNQINDPVLFLTGYSKQTLINGQPESLSALNQNNCISTSYRKFRVGFWSLVRLYKYQSTSLC